MEKLDKCKQIIIMISALLVILVMGIGVCYIVTYNKPEEKQEVKKEVASVVILDINPSIKLELDKDNKVISVTALNEDAKEIVSNNLEGKDLNEAVGTITDNLKEKGYAKEEVTILVNVTGKVTKEEIKTVIEETFEEKKVEVNVINQEITETSKENAEKYNITESKASYIEEVIKEKDNLTFEELKDKTIEELEEIKNKKEPEPSPSPSTTPTPSTSPKPTTTSPSPSNSPKPSSTSSSSSKAPSDPTKDLDAWCKYNKNGNPYGHEKPQMMDSYQIGNKTSEYVMQKYNVSNNDFILNASTTSKEDNRSSYCVAYVVHFVTKEWDKTFIVDSVTGNIIEEKSVATPKMKYTEMEARQVALEHYGLTADDAWDYAQGEVRLRIDGYNGQEIYKYFVVLSLKSGESKYLSMNALTGEILTD